ncbi:unnamed protein product [Mytilus edulis]|uniref:Death domain-containing protein n=1 Tax=Mytilus edulis TaxID=6550 RepID=A0A8S3QZE4_MYTED|nr:unnamed protein product [Mytilus edulis]
MLTFSAAQSCNFPKELTLENGGSPAIDSGLRTLIFSNTNPAFHLKFTSGGVTAGDTTISDFVCQQQDKYVYLLKSQTTIPGEGGGEDEFVYLCIKLFQDDNANVFSGCFFGQKMVNQITMVGTSSTDADDKAILDTTAVNADFCDVCRPHAIDGSVVPSDSDLYSVIRIGLFIFRTGKLPGYPSVIQVYLQIKVYTYTGYYMTSLLYFVNETETSEAQQNLQIPQIMSKEETLKQIFNLLQTNIHAYMRSSDQYIEMRERRVRRSRTMKASSCPPNTQNTKYYKDQGTCVTPPESPTECKCLCHCEQSSGLREGVNTKNEGKEDAEICSRSQKCPSSPDTENSDSIECNISEQQLSLMRENIDLKIQMQEVQKHIKGLRKDKDDDESMNQHLISIDDILSKVLCTQKRSEIMCDKLCEGLSRVKDKGKQLPAELKEFCDSIRKTVGQDYRQIGSELGIEPDILTHIEDEYSEAEECLHQIIWEWSNRTEMPSYHALVTACYNVNPDILKCKPLEEKKATLLERSYSMMCDEMLEIPLLPHLISSGVVSLKMQRYILQPKTRDQRICRLLSILKTRQNGFEALLSALDLSDQSHVSSSLKSLERQTGETLTQPEVPCTEDDGAGKMTQPCILRPKRFPSCESLDSDDNKGPAFDILMKIQDIITQAVFPDRLTP